MQDRQCKYKQCKKSENYQHLNKMDTLDNDNWHVNKVMLWIYHHMNKQ